MNDRSTTESSQEQVVRRSTRESKPSKAYDDVFETEPVAKVNKERTDSRSKRERDAAILEASKTTADKSGDKSKGSKSQKKGKDLVTMNKGVTPEVGTATLKLKGTCIVCELQSDPKLTCSRCQDGYCILCLQINDQIHREMCAISGFVWLCRNCVTPGVKCMRQDKEIEERCADYLQSVTKRIDKLEIDISDKPSKADVESMVDDRIRRSTFRVANEVEDRDKRRLSLIVHNMPERQDPEPESRQQEDIYTFEQTCSKHLKSEVTITKAIRLGKKDPESTKPRPLKVTVQQEQQKMSVLRNTVSLKDSDDIVAKNLRIHPDLTPAQQRAEKELREELKKKRNQEQDKSKEWIIKKGQITSRKTLVQTPAHSDLEEEESLA